MDILKFALCVGLIFGGFFGSVFTFANWASRKTCQEKAEAMGVKWEYGIIKDCIITTPKGIKVPLDNYRVEE